jgi:predicted nucleic acid-binding protein
VKYFVDTSFWCALYDSRDKNHGKAKGIWEELRSLPVRFFTSDYIFDETVTLIRKRIGLPQALEFGETLLNSRLVVLLEVDLTIRKQGWQVFHKYWDKEFSFTDCTSFALMQMMNINKALSFDRHFSQMGYSS